MKWDWRTLPHTAGSLSHLCWYLGTALSVAALILFTDKANDGVRALLLVLYATAAIGIALRVFAAERVRGVLVGLLILGAILSVTAALIFAQSHFDLLKYTPFPTNYATPCTETACEGLAPYFALSLPARLIQSPLGPVLAGTCLSLAGLALFRFLPLTILIVAGIGYAITDLFMPTNDHQLQACLLGCGVATTLLGWLSDRISVNNYGYWLNKLGMWAAAAGLQVFVDAFWGSKLLYFVAASLGMLIALYLRRPAGVFGFFIGAFSLIFDLYKNYHKSLVFPTALFLLGVALTYAGSWLRLNMPRVVNRVPKWFVTHRPEERREPIFFGSEALLEGAAHHGA